MKSYKRTERVADLLKRELAVLLRRSNDPLFIGVTVTHLKISPDFSHAQVFVTVLDEAKIEDTVSVLNKMAYIWRKQLFKVLHLKNIPRFRFEYDKALIRGQKLSSLIDKLNPSEE